MKYAIALLFATWAFAQNSCPVTPPPDPPFVPPIPYVKAPGPGAFFFGTPKLWVNVFKNSWKGPLWDIGYREKVVWWSEGYDWKAEPVPPILITGRRLDAPAPPMVVTGANGSHIDGQPSFIMSGVNFPTLGCWEITGRYKGAEVKFVVKVE